MADSVVGHVVDRITNEAKLAKELEESMIPLRDTLQFIQSHLKDADHRRREETSSTSQTFVEQMRDVAYDVEDVLDEYMVEVEQRQRWRMGWMDFFWSMIAFVTQICTRHDLVRRINLIKTRLENIKANKEYLSSDNTAFSSTSSGILLSGRNELEDDVVGFEEDESALIERLTDLDVTEGRVISIVGMAGLGKTTLANRIYKDYRIKNHFECQAWVSVSQAYEPMDILKKIQRQVKGQDGEEIDRQTLVQNLSECLKDKRYLVVIDDIWDNTAWDIIRAALPSRQIGSTVLLTTRQEEVARYADPFTPLHDLKFLGPEDSWTLFCKRAFQSANCPAYLKPLQKAILDKCDGLPLAIVALGGILRRTTHHEWKKVLDHLPVELRREERTWKIVALSYDLLPHHLKSCFLYFAAFPEDYEIDAPTLMQLWIAEGFMQPEHGQTMEDQAENSLKELIQRSMVLLANGEYNKDLNIAHVRIHDLFLEFARSEAKDVNFLLTQGNRDVLPVPTVRRLSLTSGYTEHVFHNWSTPKLRTLLCSPTNSQLFSSHFLESKLLRVMNLQNVEGLESLPEEIGGMTQLRYLGLRRSSVKKLPSSIGNLRNLQTLDARSTKISEITSTFWKIRTLRHVLFDENHFKSHPKIPYCLNDLHTLLEVRSGNWVTNDDLMKVPNLRYLQLHEVGSSEDEELLKSLKKLNFLTTLKLMGSSLPAEVLISFEHHNMQRMSLFGEINMCKLDPTLKSKQIFLPRLYTLVLVSSHLKEDTIMLIGALPNLHTLVLSESAYVDKVLVCPSHGFAQLTFLGLGDLPDLEELEVQDGALPCLKELIIEQCKSMRMLPEGLQHVTTLRTLSLDDMPTIKARIEKETGEDYPKIRHVRNVIVK